MNRFWLGLALLAASCGAPTVSGTDGSADGPALDVHTMDAVDSAAPPDVAATDGGGTDAARASTCRGVAEPAWLADPSLCLVHFADGLTRPRQIEFAPNGDLFVVSAAGAIQVLYDDDGDGVSGPNERATFAMQAGLNHSVAFSPDHAFVYASSPGTVYRWGYRAGARIASGPAEVVVSGMPPASGHVTRTLLFDAQGRLYVAAGSGSNLDQSTSDLMERSQIRRFTIPSSVPAGGLAYDGAGEVFASGMRNEVGLSIDAEGRIWGVENGRDDLADTDFGGDVHNDNPGEEINRFDGAGANFYGYPFCWSEYLLATGGGPTTQYADEQIAGAARKTDAWCQDVANVRPPAFVMQAHWAPLSIIEYTGSTLPADWHGDLFITSHGSWDRSPQTGRLIARAHVSSTGAVTSVEPVVGQDDGHGNLRQGEWGIRPVHVTQGPDGALYFSDDLGGSIYRIGRR